jgi:hypothetical protein
MQEYTVNTILKRHDIDIEKFKCIGDVEIKKGLIREIKKHRIGSLRDLAVILGTSKDYIFRA